MARVPADRNVVDVSDCRNEPPERRPRDRRAPGSQLGVSAKFSTPHVLSGGLAFYLLNEALTIAGELHVLFYEASNQGQTLYLDEPVDPLPPTQEIPFLWQNAFSLRFGVDYQINRRFAVRGGYVPSSSATTAAGAQPVTHHRVGAIHSAPVLARAGRASPSTSHCKPRLRTHMSDRALIRTRAVASFASAVKATTRQSTAPCRSSSSTSARWGAADVGNNGRALAPADEAAALERVLLLQLFRHGWGMGVRDASWGHAERGRAKTASSASIFPTTRRVSFVRRSHSMKTGRASPRAESSFVV